MHSAAAVANFIKCFNCASSCNPQEYRNGILQPLGKGSSNPKAFLEQGNKADQNAPLGIKHNVPVYKSRSYYLFQTHIGAYYLIYFILRRERENIQG